MRHGPQHADSAGRPFAGRSFSENAYADDDGTAPAAFTAAVARFARGEAGLIEVVDALRGARLLVPLLARAAETGEGAHGLRVDKRAELALVTVAAPDGRAVLPAFSSAASLARWNPAARPVPAPAAQVALGAAGDGTELVVLNPASPTPIGLRRSALEALATDEAWSPPWSDAEVAAAFRDVAHRYAVVAAVGVAAGDPRALLEAPEVRVDLALRPGLDRGALDELVAALRTGWADDPRIARSVDSIGVRVLPSRAVPGIS